MLSCPNGHPGKSGQGYCASCGGAITHRCPNGHEAPLGIAYCGSCGAGMSGTPAVENPGWSDPVSLEDTVRRPLMDPTPAPLGPTPARVDKGSGKLIAGLVAIGVAVAGVAAALTITLAGGHGGHHVSSATPASPATSTTVAPASGGPVIPAFPSSSPSTDGSDPTDGGTASAGSQAAATIAGYLSQSAGVRPSVQQAISGVSSCSEDPSQGESAVQQAASTREQIAQELPSLDVSQLDNGSELVSDLIQAMQDSANSDNDYASWMQDVGSGSSCSDTADDSNFQSAQSSDQTANQDKSQFASIWNAEAAQYGQQTYQPGSF